MKKIVYLHGLDTNQGGDKVSLLAQENLVWAPEMEYRNPKLFKKTLETVKKFQPDYIIGSSMGGYFGFMLASHINDVKVLLFNPAIFTPKSSDLNIINYGEYDVTGTFVLGKNDDIVNANETIQGVKENEKIKIEILKNGTHRIPYDVFEKQLRKFL